MGIFKCSVCGCGENTALSRGGPGASGALKNLAEKYPDQYGVIYHSYRAALKLKPDDPFGPFCCVCNPIWYDVNGNYGTGPKPEPTPWHGKFNRVPFEEGSEGRHPTPAAPPPFGDKVDGHDELKAKATATFEKRRATMKRST